VFFWRPRPTKVWNRPSLDVAFVAAIAYVTMLAFIRARLPWFVATWLLLYAGVGVLAAHSAIVEACGCSGMSAAGQMCPMHHSAASTARCRLINGQNSSDLAFWSILAPAGVLPARIIASLPRIPSCDFDTHSSSLIEPSDVPDAPPPRA
jgi:hypothetical protein